MDKYNVEKAIITTINRSKYHSKQKEAISEKNNGNQISKFMDGFKEVMLKGQLDHSDVKIIAEKA